MTSRYGEAGGGGGCRYISSVDTLHVGVKLAASSLIGTLSAQKWRMEKCRLCVNGYAVRTEETHTLTSTRLKWAAEDDGGEEIFGCKGEEVREGR